MAAIASLLVTVLCWAALPATVQKTPVFVSASFVDRNHLYLDNLKSNEIRVTENGQPRDVEFFAGAEIPYVYGLLIDQTLLPENFADLNQYPSGVSNSSAALSVASQILDSPLGQEAGWLATYDKQMHVVVDFTQDSGRIKYAIQQLRGVRMLEEPSLYTALLSAVQKMDQRNEKRRILIAFVDVVDSESGNRLKILKNLMATSNVELFIAGFGSKLSSGRGMPPAQSEASLRELGSVTGGDAYFRSMEGIEGLGRRISNQIRTLYTIGFESESSSEKPSQLKIECTRAGVKVKTHPVVPTLRQ